MDDNLQIEKVHMKEHESFTEGSIIFKNPRALESEKLFNHISERALQKGLKVNASKTNLLVVSASRSYEARAHFYDKEGTRIDSSKTLKALGFTFNSKGDVSTQIANLCTQFRQKVWALRHLRKAGFTEPELIEVYKTYIRPTIEYSAPIYESMLTQEQVTQVERLQYFALRNIFGFMSPTENSWTSLR